MHKSQMHCAKKPDPKGYVTYASIYGIFTKANFRERKKKNRSRGCRGLRVKWKDCLQRGHGGNLGMIGLFYIP